MKVQPFNGDFEMLASIRTATRPDNPETAQQLRYSFENRNPDYFSEWYFLWEDGAVIGYLSINQLPYSFHPEKFTIMIGIHPEHLTADRFQSAYQFILTRLEEKNPLALKTGLFETDVKTQALFQEMGFAEVLREPYSQLDLTQFDRAQFDGLIQRLRDEGIQFQTLQALSESVPDWQTRIYELDWELTLDVPMTDTPEKPSIEDYSKWMLYRPATSFDLWYVAIDGDRWVGMSCLLLDLGDETRLQTDLTGVVRSHRRRGIATALKALALAAGKATGRQLVRTSNEQNNPMYTLNLQLGFTPLPAWVEYEKPLRTAELREK